MLVIGRGRAGLREIEQRLGVAERLAGCIDDPRAQAQVVQGLADLVDSDYWAEVNNFGNRNVHIPSQYVRDYERLLTGGIWAQINMRFEYDEEGKGKNPFWIDRLVPIQVATFNLEEDGFALNFHATSGLI
jgi:hypothetical protein